MLRLTCLLILLAVVGAGQDLWAQYPWPLEPFHASQRITGTFCEYRGPSNPHFHNGVDIPQNDGTPVYPVVDGRITAIATSGANAYVRVDSFAYVHIRPNPALSIGDVVVAGQTVLGTILPGQGHVHFIDGYAGAWRNAIRAEGGLTPFEDPWPPVISDVRFYVQPTRQRLAPEQLAGPVEITFRVAEANAPPGTSTAGLNNGAYTVGYRVLTRDRQTTVFAPGDEGVVFRFDRKPDEAYVHHVFDPLQASTSRHVYIPTNTLSARSAWDTEALPEGDYTLALFAGDTRGNEAVTYVDVTITRQDVIPPPPVTLTEAVLDEGRPRFRWEGGVAEDLHGYRLYQSPDARSWTVFLDESVLPGPRAAHTHDAPVEAATYFYLTAADSARPPNLSLQSDVYGLAPDPDGRRILIVDGFDRASGSGSWQEPWHAFAATHGQALAAAGFGFDTVANEAVEDGRVDLAAYDAVVWLLGDESTGLETFSANEQARVRAYLEGGGKLFVSGSEIAWDLGYRGSTADRAFLEAYLKVRYAGDDAASATVRGVPGERFEGVSFSYGTVPYVEDYPDYYTPVGGSRAVLTYGNGRVAAVEYAGRFGTGTLPGHVFVLGFPFETITSADARGEVLGRAMAAFFPAATAAEAAPGLPASVALEAAYPNPFTAHTTLTLTLPEPARVRLRVFDLLGREVALLVDRDLPAGTHRLRWAPAGMASGTYLARLEAAGQVHTTPLVRVR